MRTISYVRFFGSAELEGLVGTTANRFEITPGLLLLA